VNIKSIALLLLLITGAALIRTEGVKRPFNNSLRGECAACYTMLAKNHLQYGPLTTGLVPVFNPLKTELENFIYYEHHPPGMVALTALFFAIIQNSSEWAARLLPILLSLISIGILFFWIKRFSGLLIAFWATGLAATVPISTYYGPFLNFESFVVPFVLGAGALYMNWLKRNETKTLIASLCLIAIGMLMDFTVIIAALLILTDNLIFSRNNNGATFKNRLIPFLYPLVSVLIFVLVRIWFTIQNSRFGAPSEEGLDFIQYLKNATFFSSEFSFPLFFTSISSHLTTLFTLPVLIASCAGLLFIIKDLFNSKPVKSETRSILILLSFGVANIVLFAFHALRHDYWIIYLYPGIYWCAGIGVFRTTSILVKLTRLYSAFNVALITSLIGAYLVVAGALETFSIKEKRRGAEELFHRGKAYANLAENNELIVPLIREPFQVTYYSGGLVFFLSPEITSDSWIGKSSYVSAKIKQFGYKDRPKIFALRSDQESMVIPAAMEMLMNSMPLERNKLFIYFQEKNMK